MAYTAYCPTRLVFSDDARVDLTREIAACGPGPLLAITDSGIVRAGILDVLRPALDAGGRQVTIYDVVPGNPGVADVTDALACGRAVGPAVLVAIGGGSAIDVGKALSILLTHGGVSWGDLQAGRATITLPALPLIAVPTTAGTGSEVSHVAVIGAADGFKKGIVHAALFPRAAVVDAGLTLSLPGFLTAATGLDALVHAIEAYLGRRANPTMDLYALAALRDLIRWLPAAVAEGSNLPARRALAQAAAWAGMAMDQAGLGLCHALCGPLAAHHEVHHGLGNAVLLPVVLAFNAEAIAPDRWPALRNAVGLPAEAGPDALPVWARAFLAGIGLPTRLRTLGLDGSTFGVVAGEATRMAMIANNVRAAGEAECLSVLNAAL